MTQESSMQEEHRREFMNESRMTQQEKLDPSAKQTGSIPDRDTPEFSHVRIGPDDAAGLQVFSEISCFPHPFIPPLLHTHRNHPHRLSRPRSALSGAIPACENPVTQPGIEPGSPWWEASIMIVLLVGLWSDAGKRETSETPGRPGGISDDANNLQRATMMGAAVHAHNEPRCAEQALRRISALRRLAQPSVNIAALHARPLGHELSTRLRGVEGPQTISSRCASTGDIEHWRVYATWNYRKLAPDSRRRVGIYLGRATRCVGADNPASTRYPKGGERRDRYPSFSFFLRRKYRRLFSPFRRHCLDTQMTAMLLDLILNVRVTVEHKMKKKKIFSALEPELWDTLSPKMCRHTVVPPITISSLWGTEAATELWYLYLPHATRHERKSFREIRVSLTIPQEAWTKVAWADESRYTLVHADGRVRLRLQAHEALDPRVSWIMLRTKWDTWYMCYRSSPASDTKTFWQIADLPWRIRLEYRGYGVWEVLGPTCSVVSHVMASYVTDHVTFSGITSACATPSEATDDVIGRKTPAFRNSLVGLRIHRSEVILVVRATGARGMCSYFTSVLSCSLCFSARCCQSARSLQNIFSVTAILQLFYLPEIGEEGVVLPQCQLFVPCVGVVWAGLHQSDSVASGRDSAATWHIDCSTARSHLVWRPARRLAGRWGAQALRRCEELGGCRHVQLTNRRARKVSRACDLTDRRECCGV
ncbi:hypothetical protein PR048_004122 [Dryococelus australis]|uniref:Uncharacterized protein n=1 Tax=Dryococelus australis TaxID=614101 RepID=A0ABQ9I5R9_9NEOP|nr:hypothetical protein PR048_004122 [Dryococelus australis]